MKTIQILSAMIMIVYCNQRFYLWCDDEDGIWVIPCQICNFLLDRFKNGFFGPDPVG